METFIVIVVAALFGGIVGFWAGINFENYLFWRL
jgi:hypothetical protein